MQHIHVQTEKSGRSLTENCSEFTEHKKKTHIIFVGTPYPTLHRANEHLYRAAHVFIRV